MVLIELYAHLRMFFMGLDSPGSRAMYCTLRGFVMGEGARVDIAIKFKSVSPVVLVKKQHYVSYRAYFHGGDVGVLADPCGEYLFRSSEHTTPLLGRGATI